MPVVAMLLAWILLVLPWGAAAAAELCVVCSEPAATYRCSVEHAEGADQFRGADKLIQYVCISQLAKAGGHGSCKVGRDAGAPCIGEPRVVSLGGATLPAETAGDGQPAATASPPPTVDGATTGTSVPGTKGKEPPRTLVELADRTGKDMEQSMNKAGDAVNKAGDAVGGAFKKTLGCIVSLFQQC
jgi:hypothetical protein